MTFSDSLRDFAAGITPLPAFNQWIRQVIVRGPTVTGLEGGKPEAQFSFELDAAMYLEMVADPDDPNFDEREARRLAGSLCAIHTQIEDHEAQAVLAHLARRADDTVERIGDHLKGRVSREAFERFLDRRPWPKPLIAAVRALAPGSLEALAGGLQVNDYLSVAELFDDDEPHW